MFIVYWIPVKAPEFHPLNYFKKSIPQINIDDIDKWLIRIQFVYGLGKKGLGKIFIEDEENGKKLAVLDILDFNSYGFILCEIVEYDETLKSGLENTIYHYVKELWHNHEFHSIEEDTLLKGLILENTQDLRLKDIQEKVLDHFLSLFVQKFAQIGVKYSSPPEKINFFSYLIEPLKLWKLHMLNKNEEDLNRYIGEGFYYETLKRFVLKEKLKEKFLEKIDIIDSYLCFLQEKRNQYRHEKEFILNVYTLIGVFLGLLSIVIGFLLS